VAGESETAPSLNLAHAVMLLALDDARGKDRTPYGMNPSLAGAILLELVDRGCLAQDGARLRPTECAEPQDELLAAALSAIARAPRPQTAEWWIKRLPSELAPFRERVALVERGVLDPGRHGLLGLGGTRYPERDPEPERRLRERLTEVLLGKREPLLREAMLVALIRPHRLERTLVPVGKEREVAERAKQIAERGMIVGAVRNVVRDMQRAIAPATVAVPSFGGTAASGG
jgi:Golgi phosphoprotein 3